MGYPKESMNETGTNTAGQDVNQNNTSYGQTGTISNNQPKYFPNLGQRGGNTRNNGNLSATSTANKNFKE